MPKPSFRTVTLALAAMAASIIGCSTDEGSSGGGGLNVAGTYNTAVSLVSSNCPFSVETHTTKVSTSATTITLTHAGTTYSGIIQPDSSFVTSQKVVTVGGTTYRITIAGDFTAAGLDAQVTVIFGTTPCTAVVHWLGPKT